MAHAWLDAAHVVAALLSVARVQRRELVPRAAAVDPISRVALCVDAVVAGCAEEVIVTVAAELGLVEEVVARLAVDAVVAISAAETVEDRVGSIGGDDDVGTRVPVMCVWPGEATIVAKRPSHNRPRRRGCVQLPDRRHEVAACALTTASRCDQRWTSMDFSRLKPLMWSPSPATFTR